MFGKCKHSSFKWPYCLLREKGETQPWSAAHSSIWDTSLYQWYPALLKNFLSMCFSPGDGDCELQVKKWVSLPWLTFSALDKVKPHFKDVYGEGVCGGGQVFHPQWAPQLFLWPKESWRIFECVTHNTEIKVKIWIRSGTDLCRLPFMPESP